MSRRVPFHRWSSGDALGRAPGLDGGTRAKLQPKCMQSGSKGNGLMHQDEDDLPIVPP